MAMSNIIHLKKCLDLRKSSWCWCGICSANRETLHIGVIGLFESIDCLTEIVVIYDGESSFGNWAHALVLDYVRSQHPSVTLWSVLRKSNFRTQGVEFYYSLFGLHNSLEFASGTIIRGNEWQLLTNHQFSASEAAEGVLSRVNNNIACDIWALCGTTAHSGDTDMLSAWPGDILGSAQCRIFDVRSSISGLVASHLSADDATTTTTKKRASTSATPSEARKEHIPQRALAQNIHSLHKAYGALFGADSTWTPAAERSIAGSFADLQIHATTHQSAAQNCLRVYTTGGATASLDGLLRSLNSATPGVSWRNGGDARLAQSALSAVSFRDRTDDVSSVPSDLSLPAGPRSVGSSRAQSHAADKGFPARTSGSGTHTRPLLVAASAVSFASRYGEQDARHTCRRTRQLLAAGAYRHIFDGQDGGCGAVMDAVHFVESFLQEL